MATPGRLLDLMGQRLVSLASIEILVIDEADRMFDMGFIHDVRRIVAALPSQRQTLLFSATMPADVDQLAAQILRDPERVEVKAANAAADTVEQSVYFVNKRNKPTLLKHLVQKSAMSRTLVFTRTKRGADKVAKHLSPRAFARGDPRRQDAGRAAAGRAELQIGSIGRVGRDRRRRAWVGYG